MRSRTSLPRYNLDFIYQFMAKDKSLKFSKANSASEESAILAVLKISHLENAFFVFSSRRVWANLVTVSFILGDIEY